MKTAFRIERLYLDKLLIALLRFLSTSWYVCDVKYIKSSRLPLHPRLHSCNSSSSSIVSCLSSRLPYFFHTSWLISLHCRRRLEARCHVMATKSRFRLVLPRHSHHIFPNRSSDSFKHPLSFSLRRNFNQQPPIDHSKPT